MLVTVITVVRNHRLGLARTIASLRCQSAGQFEFLVIDGASDDGTIDVIRANEDVVDYWESQADQGIYDAMNKGLRRAQGQLILFLNAGDQLLADDSLEVALAAAAQHADADVLYFHAIRDDGGRASRFNRRSALLFDSVGNHQAILFRAAVHKQFPFDIRYRVKADRDVQLRMFLAGHRMVHLPMVISRTEAGGVSSTDIGRKEWENLLICHRNRVGWQWSLIAAGLCASRLFVYGLARCCGADWDSAKSMRRWLPRLFRKGAKRAPHRADLSPLPPTEC